MRPITSQREHPENTHLFSGFRTANVDPSTISGVRELIERANLNPYHYFLDEIAVRVRGSIEDARASTEDGGGDDGSISAEDFFEWVYEADKGEPQSYGPNLYENNPGTNWPPVWTP